jgi:hypothetical protein
LLLVKQRMLRAKTSQYSKFEHYRMAPIEKEEPPKMKLIRGTMKNLF